MSERVGRDRLLERAKGRLEAALTPQFDWIQVEVSTHCFSSCVYCPHYTHRLIWREQHMTLDTFERLLPAMRKSRLIYLQGWGEPLTNPDFFEMVGLARGAGGRVGMTTSGTLLDKGAIERLISGGLDVIALSLAGTTERNDRLRSGNRLDQVLWALRELDRARNRTTGRRPTLHVAYLLLKSATDDLKSLPALLEGTGVDEVVISTLDFVPTPALAREVVAPETSAEFDSWWSLLEEVKADAARRGISLHFYLRHYERRRAMCTENVSRALFVSADGSVSPCVFTGLPLNTDKPSLLPPGYLRRVFGNVNEWSVRRVWNRDEYTLFRRQLATDNPPEPCVNCPKLYLVEG